MKCTVSCTHILLFFAAIFLASYVFSGGNPVSRLLLRISATPGFTIFITYVHNTSWCMFDSHIYLLIDG